MNNSENPRHEKWCDWDDCEMMTCENCMAEYNACVTAIETVSGDREVPRGITKMYELTYQCPECGE